MRPETIWSELSLSAKIAGVTTAIALICANLTASVFLVCAALFSSLVMMVYGTLSNLSRRKDSFMESPANP